MSSGYLKLLDLIQAVFRFEANRPFDEHWYGTPRPLVFVFEFDLKRRVSARQPLGFVGRQNRGVTRAVGELQAEDSDNLVPLSSVHHHDVSINSTRQSKNLEPLGPAHMDSFYLQDSTA